MQTDSNLMKHDTRNQLETSKLKRLLIYKRQWWHNHSLLYCPYFFHITPPPVNYNHKSLKDPFLTMERKLLMVQSLGILPKPNNGLGFRHSNLKLATKGKCLAYVSKNDY